MERSWTETPASGTVRHPSVVPRLTSAGNAAFTLIVQRKAAGSSKSIPDYVGLINNGAMDEAISLLNGLFSHSSVTT